jgi:DNA replication protein DnaC/DNA-binding CsgD family transcriptional regulator
MEQSAADAWETAAAGEMIPMIGNHEGHVRQRTGHSRAQVEKLTGVAVSTIATDIPVDDLLRRLHLANTRLIWRDLCERAEREEWSYEDFLATLVAEEVAHRKGTRLRRMASNAKFPFLKTIDEFDFSYQPALRLALLGRYLSTDFVGEGRSLILSGKPGRGKTHLAIAIAYRAIQNGFDALFTTAAALIDDLSRASGDDRLREALATYTDPAVLVCDEVGYLTYGTDAANVLYHVVNERYLKKRAMIFTTNKSLAAWGRVLHDEDLADTIVDRILERGRLLTLDGPSVRTPEIALDEDDDLDAHTKTLSAGDSTAAAATERPGTAGAAPGHSQPDRLKFSGNTRSHFPEPTCRGVMTQENGRAKVAEHVGEFGRRHRLSAREEQIFLQLVQGSHPKVIGDSVGCEFETVRTHLKRMQKKLGCAGTRELLVRFISEL